MLTDLGCAYQRGEALQLFYRTVEETGAVSGLSTVHLGTAHEALVDMNCLPSVLVCPINPKGYMMSPSQQRCLKILQEQSQVTVIAKEAQAGGTLSAEEAVPYALSQAGVAGVVVSFGSASEAWAALSQCQKLMDGLLEAGVELVTRGRAAI